MPTIATIKIKGDDFQEIGFVGFDDGTACLTIERGTLGPEIAPGVHKRPIDIQSLTVNLDPVSRLRLVRALLEIEEPRK